MSDPVLPPFTGDSDRETSSLTSSSSLHWPGSPVLPTNYESYVRFRSLLDDLEHNPDDPGVRYRAMFFNIWPHELTDDTLPQTLTTLRNINSQFIKKRPNDAMLYHWDIVMGVGKHITAGTLPLFTRMYLAANPKLVKFLCWAYDLITWNDNVNDFIETYRFRRKHPHAMKQSEQYPKLPTTRVMNDSIKLGTYNIDDPVCVRETIERAAANGDVTILEVVRKIRYVKNKVPYWTSDEIHIMLKKALEHDEGDIILYLTGMSELDLSSYDEHEVKFIHGLQSILRNGFANTSEFTRHIDQGRIGCLQTFFPLLSENTVSMLIKGFRWRNETLIYAIMAVIGFYGLNIQPNIVMMLMMRFLESGMTPRLAMMFECLSYSGLLDRVDYDTFQAHLVTMINRKCLSCDKLELLFKTWPQLSVLFVEHPGTKGLHNRLLVLWNNGFLHDVSSAVLASQIVRIGDAHDVLNILTTVNNLSCTLSVLAHYVRMTTVSYVDSVINFAIRRGVKVDVIQDVFTSELQHLLEHSTPLMVRRHRRLMNMVFHKHPKIFPFEVKRRLVTLCIPYRQLRMIRYIMGSMSESERHKLNDLSIIADHDNDVVQNMRTKIRRYIDRLS